ncbi:hypothetical protein CHU98_g12036, partial [Xylaria longipes]
PDGEAPPDVQATARLRDLSQWQLANGRGMDMDEFFELLSGMGDSMGRFIIVNQYSAPNGALVVHEVRFQLHVERQSEGEMAPSHRKSHATAMEH